jgi:hypothetical protein
MLALTALLFTCMVRRRESAAQPACVPPSAAFVASIDAALHTTAASAPATPALPCEVLRGLDVELRDPGTRAHFDQLVAARSRPPVGTVALVRGMEYQRRVHVLLALTTHGDLDTRITALRLLRGWLQAPSKSCTVQSEHARTEAEDRRDLRLLLQTFRALPRQVTGRGKATVYANDLRELALTLHELTREHEVSANTADVLPSWHDARWSTTVVRWSSHELDD